MIFVMLTRLSCVCNMIVINSMMSYCQLYSNELAFSFGLMSY